MLTLVLALGLSTLMVLVALVVRTTSLTAPEAQLSVVPLAMQRMLESDAKVCCALLMHTNQRG